MDERIKLLKEITELPGVSGYEDEVRGYIRDHMTGFAEISRDNLGSAICKKTGSSDTPRIMMAGHMDEVGMMVTYITKEGFLKFQTLGGWWEQVMLAQRVVIKTLQAMFRGLSGLNLRTYLETKNVRKWLRKTRCLSTSARAAGRC